MIETGAGRLEAFPVPGRRLSTTYPNNINLPSLDPADALDPRTATTSINAVEAHRPLVLNCRIATGSNTGPWDVFTAPEGTEWLVSDCVIKSGQTVANSTTVLTTNTGDVFTALAVDGAGEVHRPAAGWNTANAVVASEEALTITVAAGDEDARPAQEVTIFLQRTT